MCKSRGFSKPLVMVPPYSQLLITTLYNSTVPHVWVGGSAYAYIVLNPYKEVSGAREPGIRVNHSSKLTL